MKETTHPRHSTKQVMRRIARWLAAMEAMTGLLYVAVLIARLVSLYSAAKSDDS